MGLSCSLHPSRMHCCQPPRAVIRTSLPPPPPSDTTSLPRSILSYFGYLNGLPYGVTLSYPSGGGPSITDVAGSQVTVYLAASVFGTSESSSAIYLLDTELPRILPAEVRGCKGLLGWCILAQAPTHSLNLRFKQVHPWLPCNLSP